MKRPAIIWDTTTLEELHRKSTEDRAGQPYAIRRSSGPG
jgi:hypothetical protein